MAEQKVVVIGIDGAQLESLSETPTPNLDSLNLVEGFTGGERGTETEQETFSGPGWGTLLTGVWANKHGIVENDDTLRANPEYPSVFEYVHNDNPDNYIASVVNWGPINAYFEEDINSIVDFEITAPEPTDDNLAQDDFIAPEVADLILEEAPEYTFVHLDNVDVVGHDFGFGEGYLESIAQADGHVGTILDAVEAREAEYPDEDWLVLVTTDRGREPTEGFDHGEQSDSERTVWVASNQELDDSEVSPQTDVVPTVLDHLGIEGGEFDGESLLLDELELPTPRDEALPFTHAHNDYENENPLFDALSYGFVSVEADIWLYPDDKDNLRVAHDPVDDPTTLPTLEELYLDPLQELKEEFDNGGVYADWYAPNSVNRS